MGAIYIKKKRWFVFIVGTSAILILVILYTYFPQKMASVVGFGDSIVDVYYILDGMPTGTSVDLSEDEMLVVFRLLENTYLQYSGTYSAITNPSSTKVYRIYLLNEKKQSQNLLIDENNYMYSNGIRYKILDEKKSVYIYLNSLWPE